MKNEPNDNPETGGKNSARRPRRRAAAAGLDPALTAAFKKVPFSREGMVERARQLVADPNYPSDETLRQMSEILATHLQSDGFSY